MSTNTPADQSPTPESSFDTFQKNIQTMCDSPEYSSSPLCTALKSSTVPFSCLFNVIEKHSTCDLPLTPKTKQAAYKAFTDVTHYKPLDLNAIFGTLNETSYNIVNFTAFYICMPVLLLFLIIIWLMVGFRWIHWPLGIFMTVIVFVILYGFTVGYRIHAQNYLNTQLDSLKQVAQTTNDNFATTIAYLPQGLFAVSCAIDTNGASGSWECNKNPNSCQPCNNNNITPKTYNDDLDNFDDSDDTEIEELRRKRRRARRIKSNNNNNSK